MEVTSVIDLDSMKYKGSLIFGSTYTMNLPIYLVGLTRLSLLLIRLSIHCKTYIQLCPNAMATELPQIFGVTFQLP